MSRQYVVVARPVVPGGLVLPCLGAPLRLIG
jgi:hypothetical protein